MLEQLAKLKQSQAPFDVKSSRGQGDPQSVFKDLSSPTAPKEARWWSPH